jgi:hypothetical protein
MASLSLVIVVSLALESPKGSGLSHRLAWWQVELEVTHNKAQVTPHLKQQTNSTSSSVLQWTQPVWFTQGQIHSLIHTSQTFLSWLLMCLPMLYGMSEGQKEPKSLELAHIYFGHLRNPGSVYAVRHDIHCQQCVCTHQRAHRGPGSLGSLCVVSCRVRMRISD